MAAAGALEFRAVLNDRRLDVEFNVEAGEVLAILGPNGAGKSSLLHIIAGMLDPDVGRVCLGSRVLTDTQRGVDVATRDRRVGLLLQDPLLFPHMSVIDNVAFGPHSSRRFGFRGQRDRRLAHRWLRAVGADELADRRPHRLSGGEAQRVAIARALAAEPEVLLLDEPLSGLDVAGAATVRTVLRDVIGSGSTDGRSAVLVTHDLLDVFALADRVLVLEAGRVVEIGPAEQILSAPRSRFGAQIAGMNLVDGVLCDRETLQTPTGQRWHGVRTNQPDGLLVGGGAVAVFSPSAVAVYRSEPHGSPRNCVPVTVAGLEARGAVITVRGMDQPGGVRGLAADVTADAAGDLRLSAGDSVWFCVKAQEVALRPALRSAATG